MAQKRDPPAYQEYASEFLANSTFRMMTLEQRGLLQTMRLECWANKKLPGACTQLSMYLGKQISPDLLDSVMPFFLFEEGWIVCPELENYRSHLKEIRGKQSEGGKAGAKITNKKRSNTSNTSKSAKSSGDSQVTRRDTSESLVESSSEKQSQNQLIEKNFDYLDADGVDPLIAELNEGLRCKGCAGEGCEWCK